MQMRRPAAIAARIRSHASSMSPSRNGSCGAWSPARNACAAAASVYPRRTSTPAVSSLIPSDCASSTCTRCGDGLIVQVPSCIVQPRYGHGRTDMRDLFLLDPEVTYLNHGSFGACPRPVFEAYQRRQRELEREPVEFIIRRLPDLLAESRAALGAYVGASRDDLTFVPNAGTGVNMAARAVGLAAGDEVLATDLEYGAMNFTWEWVCGRAGASYVCAPWTELFDHVTERTRVLYLSHITSETALELPVAELVAHGRELGLVTIVDGAHVPGHVPLDIGSIGADFYAG